MAAQYSGSRACNVGMNAPIYKLHVAAAPFQCLSDAITLADQISDARDSLRRSAAPKPVVWPDMTSEIVGAS